MSEFFAMNAPDPPHWTLNLCFVLFRSVWLHFGPFRCFTILGSKRAELLKLMQKFKPQSCVWIFCNKSTLSTACFGAFHSVWVHLGPFRYCMKLGAKWAEMVQLMQKSSRHEVVSEFFTMNAPDPPHWTLNTWIGVFFSVWVHFGLFRYCMKLGAK